MMNQAAAQTPFISQNFTASSYFNPASVGFGSYNRFQSFYRSQFSGVGKPYKTIGLAADFGFLRNDKTEPNNFGFGVQGISEQVLDGVLQTNYITATIADRIFFDDFNNHYLAIGLGSSLITRTVDYQNLVFGDQFYAGRLLSPTSMEVLNSYQTKSTINVGAIYSFNSDRTFFQIGASSYFINRVSGLTSDSLKPANQFNQILGQFNYEQVFSEDKTLMVHANYQNRYEDVFYYVGAAIGIPFNYSYDEVNRFYMGCFYRSKDAVVPYVGLMFNKYKLGITYDIYNNDLTAANLKPQTFEFSLTSYFGKRRSHGLRSLFD